MRKWERKHRALEEKYDHYVCDRCMEIGANEVISEFLSDIDYILKDIGIWTSKQVEIRKKWEQRKKE